MTDATPRGEWAPSADFWRHRPVAVTGADGFAGTHLVAKLVDLRADVVTLAPDDGPGGVWERAEVEHLLGGHRIVTVFHLGGEDREWVAESAPARALEANVAGTWTLLDSVRRTPSVAQVVVASSDAAYGAQPTMPCTEEMPPAPGGPLDLSRGCADLVATGFGRTFGVPVVVGRCPTVFGPGETEWARLVPSVVRSLVEGRPPRVCEDRDLRRDYLFVEDAALAYLRLAEALAERPGLGGEIFNFSAERPVTVSELVEILQIAAGTRVDPEFEPVPAPAVPVRYLSAGKARQRLGWRPQHTFEEAVLLTTRWYRGHLDPPPG